MYLFTHQRDVFSPDQKVDIPIEDVEEFNRNEEANQIAWLKTGPEKVFLYVHAFNFGLQHEIRTWLGTPVATDLEIGYGVYSGFGGALRSSVRCKIFGVRYHGWYFESSGDYCRLRRSKAQ